MTSCENQQLFFWMSHWIFLFIVLLTIFGNAWQNHFKWLLCDRQIRSTSNANNNNTISACNMREENSTWVFYFSKQGTGAGRLHYFYGLLFKKRASNEVRNEVDYLGGIDWMSVKRMYFVELQSSQWLSCRILNTPALNIWM